jgi:GMP synthase-like glutamine amidotransferase
MTEQHLSVAVLSMYRDQESQGMKYIRYFLDNAADFIPGLRISYRIFATRKHNELPGAEDFDVFISTGGPGDPHDGLGQDWEKNYFAFLRAFQARNQSGKNPGFLFSICHSFQLLCRFFDIAQVVPRSEPCFGIMECRPEQAGKQDLIFGKLPDPFLVVENRSWQCIQPDEKKMHELGIAILARELHPLPGSEAALLAMRISPYWLATQFHPEANPEEMKQLFSTEKKKQEVLTEYCDEKWEGIMNFLQQQNPSLTDTYHCLLPGFFRAVLAVRTKLRD